MDEDSKYKDIACIIFAGGKSRRMGEDKALLPFGGEKTLTEYQYKKFKPYFENIYISTKFKDKFNFDADFIEDIEFYEEDNPQELIYSPAVAMYSVFKKYGFNKIFAISVDTPFFNIEHFKKLYNADNNSLDMIISRTKDGIHPLCSIYKKSCQDELLKMIEQDVHKLRILAKILNTEYIDFEDEEPFLNLNDKETYKKALKI
jgi:molybdopterin-guanine dinucleotide biosynthesis protein A